MEYFEQLAQNIERLDPDEIRQIINLCKFHLASRGIDPEKRLKLEKEILPQPKPLAEVLQFRGDEGEILKEKLKEYMGLTQNTPKTYTFQFKGGGKAKYGRPYVAKMTYNEKEQASKREYLPIPTKEITTNFPTSIGAIKEYQLEGEFTLKDKEAIELYYGRWEHRQINKEYKVCNNGELTLVDKNKLLSYLKGDLQWKDLF